ncbi:hypothetical protein D3C78_1744730 [compost metagenome]
MSGRWRKGANRSAAVAIANALVLDYDLAGDAAAVTIELVAVLLLPTKGISILVAPDLAFGLGNALGLT